MENKTAAEGDRTSARQERRKRKITQARFNRILTKIREQGGPSVGEDGLCKYRGANGRRCAIGWLIPDSKYVRDWDLFGETAYEIAALLFPGWDGDDARTIQRIHDRAAVTDLGQDAVFMTSFERGMKDYAKRSGLRYTEPSS